MTEGSVPGTCALELVARVREWQPGPGMTTRRLLRSRSLTVFVDGKETGRQCVNLHPRYSPMGEHAEHVYSLALAVARASLRSSLVHADYAVWGLCLLFSFRSIRQYMHDDFQTLHCDGGVSVVVALDDRAGLWVREGETESLASMRKCGDFLVFSCGTLHGGAEFTERDFPQGHWRLFCYAAPQGVACSGDGMVPPGLCSTLMQYTNT